MKHTPTPWSFGWTGDPKITSKDKARPISIISFNKGEICSLKPHTGNHQNNWEIAEANAKFIVRACNAYEDLMKAIDNFLSSNVSGWECDKKEFDTHEFVFPIECIRELKKAFVKNAEWDAVRHAE